MAKKQKHKYREAWLDAAASLMRKEFFQDEHKLPRSVRVSCGFPRGSGEAIGQCWDPKVAKDGSTQVFVCPSQADKVQVLGILLHELIHAAVGIQEGHKGEFRKLAKRFGLAGKLTATYVEKGTPLYATLRKMGAELGPYPHKGMSKKAGRSKRPGGLWVRYRSVNVDGYRVLVSPKMLEDFGAPRDPWGDEMVPAR